MPSGEGQHPGRPGGDQLLPTEANCSRAAGASSTCSSARARAAAEGARCRSLARGLGAVPTRSAHRRGRQQHAGDYFLPDYRRAINANGTAAALVEVAGGDFRDLLIGPNSTAVANGLRDRASTAEGVTDGEFTLFIGGEINVILWLKARFPGPGELADVTSGGTTPIAPSRSSRRSITTSSAARPIRSPVPTRARPRPAPPADASSRHQLVRLAPAGQCRPAGHPVGYRPRPEQCRRAAQVRVDDHHSPT